MTACLGSCTYRGSVAATRTGDARRARRRRGGGGGEGESGSSSGRAGGEEAVVVEPWRREEKARCRGQTVAHRRRLARPLARRVDGRRPDAAALHPPPVTCLSSAEAVSPAICCLTGTLAQPRQLPGHAADTARPTACSACTPPPMRLDMRPAAVRALTAGATAVPRFGPPRLPRMTSAPALGSSTSAIKPLHQRHVAHRCRLRGPLHVVELSQLHSRHEIPPGFNATGQTNPTEAPRPLSVPSPMREYRPANMAMVLAGHQAIHLTVYRARQMKQR